MARKDDEETGFTGKRKKSYRELDAQRGKSKYHSRQDDPQQQRIERSASYEKYKKAADSLFSGGELPQGLAQTFDPAGKRKVQKEAMAKLRELPDRKAWVQGVVDYLAQYPELPEDAFFLDSLLDHPKDRIVDQALTKLEALQAEGKLPREKTPKSLPQRLKAIELTGSDPDTQARAKALNAKLS
ncbi:MAG: hypothetical protein K1X89_03855 [Myxococcaceae bacterium]|nr:hypothetical protein [Myxococcaceae bacterium]